MAERQHLHVPQRFVNLKNEIIDWLEENGLGWLIEDLDREGLFFVNTLADMLMGVWYIRSRENNIKIEIPDLFSALDKNSDQHLKAKQQALADSTKTYLANHEALVKGIKSTELCLARQQPLDEQSKTYMDRKHDAIQVEFFSKFIDVLTQMIEKPYFRLDRWVNVKKFIVTCRGYFEMYVAYQKRMNPRDYNN